MTWGPPIINSTSLPRHDLQACARDRRTEVMISEVKSYTEVHEIHLVAECGSRVAWKTLSRYVDGQFIVPIQIGTDLVSVSDPSKRSLWNVWVGVLPMLCHRRTTKARDPLLPCTPPFVHRITLRTAWITSRIKPTASAIALSSLPSRSRHLARL